MEVAALPSLALFDILADGEQVLRLEGASDPSHGIREPRPWRRVDRLGAVQTRHFFYDDGALLEPAQRQGDLFRRLAEVRAKANKTFMGGHARL